MQDNNHQRDDEHSDHQEHVPETGANTDEKTASLEVTEEALLANIPTVMPLLPIRDIVVYPFMLLPLFIGRDLSVNAVNKALSSNRYVFLSTQKDPSQENPQENDLYRTGTVASIIRMLRLPDGRVKVLVQGLRKGVIEQFFAREGYHEVEVRQFDDLQVNTSGVRTEALIRNVKEHLGQMVQYGRMILPDVLALIDSMDDPGKLADIVAANMSLKVEDAQEVLAEPHPVKRLRRVYDLLSKELKLLDMQMKIQTEAKGEMDKLQREYYLREQLKAIQKELGDTDDVGEEVRELEEKISKAGMPKDVHKEAMKQLGRYRRMHQDASEANIIRTYLEWLIEIPWKKKTKDNLDLKKAMQILNEDHFGLQDIKDRIVEYLGVKKLKPDMKGPIICFAGPPGTGKTSLGKSIARALGRKFVRISLGGVRDEAEIRGHRRTYVGAMPGKIVQGMKTAGTVNPLFMLDEIDKLGYDYKGDPSSAMLEVLDPEQNNSFQDHYIGLPYDLSGVMFICTANNVHSIPAALRDRMEIIELSSYTEEEKLQIARKYLIPRQMEANGISEEYINLSQEALEQVVRQYTREAGLRNLERELGKLCRKVAKKVADGHRKIHRISVTNLHHYLGTPKFLPDEENKEDNIGVVNGLAWTQVGGEILLVEVASMSGKGNLMLTGQLGDVMKESAHAALTYAKHLALELKLKTDIFSKRDYHVHVPAGAIPKDGPSAGITIATAIVSDICRIPVRHDVAMTGEITIRGNVLPIGGLKEKALAAARGDIRTIIIPKGNEKDLRDIPKKIRDTLTIHVVKHVREVLEIALTEPLDSVVHEDTEAPES
ncbi:endopeptidase La [Desulfurispirillum indicum]|uniref:Lon protease n=1 Tax=Desulfurispirillum indicum (strain ATCC BAA-1389 / DSM 22839 / S5) TaxID=653733 RepID=E6W559_DESIS|nr:endopeptidase La [Desulfurispirillum indicum]ADU67138.1 ATP-dependent protease La [Desulfurispirillum indicum S5]UCZ56463.1 endopeptidase La [Desulfurispirillum indicum]